MFPTNYIFASVFFGGTDLLPINKQIKKINCFWMFFLSNANAMETFFFSIEAHGMEIYYSEKSASKIKVLQKFIPDVLYIIN